MSSNYIYVLAGGAVAPPAAPVLDANPLVTSSTITPTWNAVAGTYTLQRAPVNNGTVGTFATLSPGPGTAKSYQDGGLTYLSAYAYRVKVTVNGVDSNYSNVIQATAAGSQGNTNFDPKTLTFTQISAGPQSEVDFQPTALNLVSLDFAQSSSTAGLQGYTAPGGTTQGTMRFEGEGTGWGGGSYGDGQSWAEDRNSPQLYSSGSGVYSNAGNTAARTRTASGRIYALAVPTDPTLGTIALLVRRSGQADVIKQFDQSGASAISARRAELTIDMGSYGTNDFVAIYSVTGYADYDYLEVEDGLPPAGPPTPAAVSISNGALNLNVNEGIYFVQSTVGPKGPFYYHSVTLFSLPTVTGGTEGDVVYGCGQDQRNYCGIVHHIAAKTVQATYCVNGQNTYSPDVYDVSGLGYPLSIDFCNTGSILTALVKPSGQAVADDKVVWPTPINFNAASRYTGSTPDKFMVLAYAGVGCTVTAKVSRIRSGGFGATNESDNSFVTYEDGSLYTRNGKVFKRLSPRPFNTPVSSLQQLVRNGVDTVVGIDIASLGFNLTPVRAISGQNFKQYADGNLWGEASGCLMFDRPANLWQSGDTGYHYLIGDSTSLCRLVKSSSSEDMITDTRIFPNTVPLSLDPNKANDIAYDGGITREPDGSYRRGYATKTQASPVNESEFWPKISASYDNQQTWTVLNDDKAALNTGQSYEGARPCRIGGVTYLAFASRVDVRFYKSSDGSYYGSMPLPASLQNLTFAPHFAAGEIQLSDGKTRVLFVTMNSNNRKKTSQNPNGQQYTNGEQLYFLSDQFV